MREHDVSGLLARVTRHEDRDPVDIEPYIYGPDWPTFAHQPMAPCTDDHGLRGDRLRIGRVERPLWLWLVLAAFLFGWLLGVRVQAAEKCIELQVRPRVLMKRGDIHVQTRIRRHADHRGFTVAWASDFGSQGSSGPHALAGEDGPALDHLWLRDQPAGHYVFEARVFDAGGRELGADRQEILTPEASQ